ncbi:MAG: hypothetical protein ACI4DU_00445 [Lachnospiraceae bacterium]
MKKKNMKKTNRILLMWYSHPRIAVSLVLLTINLFVIFLFTTILTVIRQESFLDVLSYLFTFTINSGGIYEFLNDKEDVASLVIFIILAAVQMVVFAGALIGFTTDIIQTTFDNRLENKGKMYLKNHYVFLNWSTIGQNIIYDLSFLDGEKTVVILTEDDREDVINSIDNIFTSAGKKRKNLRIFVKKGDPTSSKHLSDISISEAKHIGVLLPKKGDDNRGDISTKDLTVFKLMLLLIGEAPKANIVVETEDEVVKDKIEELISRTYPNEKNRISVFSHNSVMGHVLGRMTIDPAYAALFQHVLSYDGVEFYGIQTMDLETALYSYNGCIPVVNYDDDEEIDENGEKQADQLYVLSENEWSLGLRTEKKSFVKPLEYKDNIKIEDFTLYIISDSKRSQFLVSELETINMTYHAQIRYKTYSYKDNIKDIVHDIENSSGKRKILMMSEENPNMEEQDTEIFLLLLYLKTNSAITDDIDIYVELVNLDNMVPVRNLGIASAILTNKIISLYMLQLLTHAESRRFFKDILLTNSDEGDEGDIDLEIVPAEQLLVFKEDSLEFSCYSELVQSFFIASGKKKMLLGYFLDGMKEICFFCNDMDKKKSISIKPGDKLVVATY